MASDEEEEVEENIGPNTKGFGMISLMCKSYFSA